MLGLSPTITKFLYAMGGVAISAILLIVFLTIYKKLFGKKSSKPSVNSVTPSSTEEAITFFINKNKLK